MKKYLLLLLALSASVALYASGISFNEKQKYRFVCKYFNSGSLVIGANHSSKAYLYYDTSQESSDDSWWYIRKKGKGYTISNAKEGTYITYDPERIEGVAKGLILSTAPMGADSQWTFEEMNGYVVIRNVQAPEQWFNLRPHEGLMGTYAGTGTDNELFTIYDSAGNCAAGGGGSTGDDGTLASVLDSLRLNNKQLVHDATSGNYFFPLPASLREGGDFNATLTFKPKAGYENCRLTLAGQEPDATTQEICISDINCGTDFPIVLTDADGNEIAKGNVQFTLLPIVEVNVPYCNGSYYTTGTIRLTDSNFEGHDSIFIAAYRYRGATAQGKEKKSYAIKLRDGEGNSVDRKFLGLREDNNWILDAMAVDPSCMRNRVATDLWNDYSTPPYYKDREKKVRTGTRGQFVEVFLNGAYHGLYCMTEKMDRKQLKLKKFVSAENSATGDKEIHGLLYKSSQWSYEVLMGHEMDQQYFPGHAPRSFQNTMGMETWAEYEFKYPDFEEEAVDWEPLWNAINFVATAPEQNFDSKVKQVFDYPVLVDYYLLIDYLLATDNHGKNMFFYVYDQTDADGTLMSLAPWDMDGTWGARWDGSTDLTAADQDFETFLWDWEHGQLTLFYKLNQTDSWQRDLADRYAELRATHFNADNLKKRVADYAGLFAASHADSREEARWSYYHPSIQNAADYMKKWAETRIAKLDEKYGFDPAVAAVNDAKAESYFNVSGNRGSIGIRCGQDMEVSVHSLSGTLVRKVSIHSGFNVINGLAPGIYMVNGKKVVVE